MKTPNPVRAIDVHPLLHDHHSDERGFKPRDTRTLLQSCSCVPQKGPVKCSLQSNTERKQPNSGGRVAQPFKAPEPAMHRFLHSLPDDTELARYGLPERLRLKVVHACHYPIVGPSEGSDRHQLVAAEMKQPFDNGDLEHFPNGDEQDAGSHMAGRDQIETHWLDGLENDERDEEQCQRRIWSEPGEPRHKGSKSRSLPIARAIGLMIAKKTASIKKYRT